MIAEDPELIALINAARALDSMSSDEIEAQRRSWVAGARMEQAAEAVRRDYEKVQR